MPPVMGVPPGHAPILYCISGQKSNGGRIWVVGGNPTTSDFEDAVQMMAAVQADAQYLVTRNVQDYKAGPLPALQPVELLALV
jgi:hypothetical protein